MNDLYVCNVTSYYHFLGLCSYFEGKHVKGAELYIFIGTFLEKVNELPLDKLYKYVSSFKICSSYELLEEKLGINLKKKTYKSVRIVSPSFKPYKLSKILRRYNLPHDIVVIEEGIGTYSSFSQEIAFNIYQLYGKRKVSKFYFYFLAVMKTILKHLYFSFYKNETWFNFDKKSLEENKLVILSYKSAISYIYSDMENSLIDEGLDDSIVLFSAPYCELGIVNEDDFYKFIHGIKDNYGKDGRFYIKPHPIESADKYKGVNVISSRIPTESILFHMHNIDKVLSFSSTAIYTSSLFFDIKVYRVNKYDFLYERLGKKQKAIIDRYSILL